MCVVVSSCVSVSVSLFLCLCLCLCVGVCVCAWVGLCLATVSLCVSVCVSVCECVLVCVGVCVFPARVHNAHAMPSLYMAKAKARGSIRYRSSGPSAMQAAQLKDSDELMRPWSDKFKSIEQRFPGKSGRVLQNLVIETITHMYSANILCLFP